MQNKDALVEELRKALARLDEFCSDVGVNLAGIEGAARALDRLTLLGEATDALVAPDDRRKSLLAQARFADRLYASIKPHKRASEFAVRMSTVTALAEKVREATAPEKVDLAEVLQKIGDVLDRSIEGVDIAREGPPRIDLSRIDFEALAKKFKKSNTKNLDLERLKAAIRAKLDQLIAVNETRVNLREKFEEMIEAYNTGAVRIEQVLAFIKEMTDEETRHVRENLTEEELTVFDLLTRPGPDLSAKEHEEVKKVARQLLARLQEILSVDWQKTATARAKVRDAIEEALDDGLPRAYTPDVFKAKAGAVFQHVYERYGRAA